MVKAERSWFTVRRHLTEVKDQLTEKKFKGDRLIPSESLDEFKKDAQLAKQN